MNQSKDHHIFNYKKKKKNADKKAIINIKNNDERCLEWALISVIYPDKSHYSNQESRYQNILEN